MSYIGNTNTTQGFTPAIDYFSGNASTTAFTLSRPVASVAQVQAVVNNVAQNPSDAFTVSNNTITFTSAPSSGTNNIYVYYTSPITQVIAPSQGTVGLTQLSATGTPSSSTYLRGDNAWSGLSATHITAGTLAKARLPAGAVLQVVSTTKTDTFSSSTNSSWVSVTGITASITPTSATSKIMIFMDFALSMSTTVNIIQYRLTRGGSAVGVGDARGSRGRTSGAGGTISSNASNTNYSKVATFLDSPATTSAVTYGVDVFNPVGTFYVNRNGEDSDSVNYYTGTSSITLMEISV